MATPAPLIGLSADQLASTAELIIKSPLYGVIAPTGSGKSTKLPLELVKRGASIFCTEITIPAVATLGTYMKTLLPGKVGTAAEGDVKYTNRMLSKIRGGPDGGSDATDTQLVYCTSGHLRRVMVDLARYAMSKGVKGVQLDFCSVIYLDETDAGILDYDVVMHLWRFLVQNGAQMPRLVLASATLDPATVPFANIPTTTIRTQSYPVEIAYANTTSRIDANGHYSRTGEVILERHRTDPPVKGKPIPPWICFCPGKAEIDLVLERLAAAKDSTLLILKAHSENTAEEMTAVFKPAPAGVRKIILATNVAERAITIDDLGGVFSTMAERVGETSASGGYRLALHRISKSSAKQQAGRAGRTRSGFCVRMCSEELFESLPAHRPSEIERIPLHSMIIEVMSAGLSPSKLFEGVIAPARLESTISLLKHLGVVSEINLQVTSIGQFVTHFPLAIRDSILLRRWIRLEKWPLFPIVSLVCLINSYGPSYYYYPPLSKEAGGEESRKAQLLHYQKHFQQYAGSTQLETLLRMWLALLTKFQTLQPKPNALSKYCSTNSLNHRKVRELFTGVRQVCNILKRMKYQLDLGPFDPVKVLTVATPLLTEIYTEQVMTRVGRGTTSIYQDQIGRHYSIDNRIPLLLQPPSEERILALITMEIQKSTLRKESRYITLHHPFTYLPPPRVEAAAASREDQPASPVPILLGTAPVRSTSPVRVPPLPTAPLELPAAPGKGVLSEEIPSVQIRPPRVRPTVSLVKVAVTPADQVNNGFNQSGISYMN